MTDGIFFGDDLRPGFYLLDRILAAGPGKTLYSVYFRAAVRVPPDPEDYWISEFGVLLGGLFTARAQIPHDKGFPDDAAVLVELSSPVKYQAGEVVAYNLRRVGYPAPLQGFNVLPVFELRGA